MAAHPPSSRVAGRPWTCCYTACMASPERDWSYYEERCLPAKIAWLRSLTPEESIRIYLELAAVAEGMVTDPEERRRLEAWRWERKLETRLRMVRAFQALDRQQGR